MRLSFSSPLLCALTLGCGTDPCPEGQTHNDSGTCVDWNTRYEPKEQLDADNVVYYSGEALTQLELPPPPKSGFRLIMDPMTLEPYADITTCNSWQLPEFENRAIYTSVLHTTMGLHHGNMYAVKLQDGVEPEPSPGCTPGAAGHIGLNVNEVLNGDMANLDIPEVLFASSTQVVGDEFIAFNDGTAFRLEEGRQIVLDTHVYNPTDQPITVEVAYDFYTMPDEKVTQEVAPFTFLWMDFELPPNQESSLEATCDWFGGDVNAIMPHMHQWGTQYDVDYLRGDGSTLVSPYSKSGVEMPESDLQMYSPAISTAQATQVRFTCEYFNPFDHQMCNGVGENEMCFLFGYVSPPEAQVIGMIPTEGAPCIALNTGRPETIDFDLATYLGELDDETFGKVLDLMSVLDAKFEEGADISSTCPEESP